MPQRTILTPETLASMPPEQKAKLVQENSERVRTMPDAELKSMIDMMKGNKEYMRNMYKAQGMDMSD